MTAKRDQVCTWASRLHLTSRRCNLFTFGMTGLYHTEHHLGGQASGRSNADEELEAYTVDFRNYFHQLRSFRSQWAPLIEYYEEASGRARRAAARALRL